MITKLRFRNLYGEGYKQKFENCKPANITAESNLIKGNGLYTAFAWQSSGGGNLAILKNNEYRKLEANVSLISGHSGAVNDFDFYPFDDNYVVTASEDTHIRLWEIPTDFKENLSEPKVELKGHGKKVTLVAWNPSSEWILASASTDNTIKVWNVQKPDQEPLTFTGPDVCTSLEWNHDGSLIGSIWKDKVARIIDPRQGKVVHEVNAHEGSKSAKFCWLGETGLFVTVGFSKSFERQVLLWDTANLEKAAQSINLDSSAGVIYPFYDEDSRVLYLAGKGDGNVRFFELCEGQLHYTSQYSTTVSGRGFGFFPKRCVDTKKCELMKGLKLTDNSVEHVAFIAPRKSEAFQEDLYPDCLSEVPAQNADDWWSGKNAKPNKRSMRPDASSPTTKKQGGGFKVSSETEKLKQRIEELEALVESQKQTIDKLEQELKSKQ